MKCKEGQEFNAIESLFKICKDTKDSMDIKTISVFPDFKEGIFLIESKKRNHVENLIKIGNLKNEFLNLELIL